MICAYDKFMLSYAQNLLGTMLDYSCYGLGYELEDFYSLFLKSVYSKRIEAGDTCTIMGKSGVELCCDILHLDEINKDSISKYNDHAMNGRSPEYWTGWVIAYYQWMTSLSFSEINNVNKVDNISTMYKKYHEMDIMHFADRMNELYKEKYPDTRLKQMRTMLGYSQRELSELTGIPLKTIQQYEQRQKNINHAKVDYLVSLSRAMSCDIELLIEKIP